MEISFIDFPPSATIRYHDAIQSVEIKNWNVYNPINVNGVCIPEGGKAMINGMCANRANTQTGIRFSDEIAFMAATAEGFVSHDAIFEKVMSSVVILFADIRFNLLRCSNFNL